MKTFYHLIREVLKKKLCRSCGGCTAICSGINFGALDVNASGKPIYGDAEKCIECGLCYAVCPETQELDGEIKRRCAWSEPLGKVLEITVVKASPVSDSHRQTSDSKFFRNEGAETEQFLAALFVHLFDHQGIDALIVNGAFGKEPHTSFLATDRDHVQQVVRHMAIADEYPLNSEGGLHTDRQVTNVDFFKTIIEKGARRVALFAPPCRIKSIRKMQALNLLPGRLIYVCIGLFCNAGKFMGCRYCSDYSAEYADISVGKTGAPKGWNSLIVRSDLGKKILTDGFRYGVLEQFSCVENPQYATDALKEIRGGAAQKRKKARHNRRNLEKQSIQVSIF